jgi:two-component system CheB/CheR fusion protein
VVASRSDEQPLRVWVPGCSTGEEAYSLAILLREGMERAKRRIAVRLFATDVDTEAIDQARTGVYPAVIATDVGAERLQRYFVHEDGTYRVAKDIRDMIVFAPHNLLTDPPFTKLDLLSCRNVLIYMDAELQERLMTLFHYALRPGGYLFLGSSESIGAHEDLFGVLDKKAKLYMRKQGGSQPRLTQGHAIVPLGRRAEITPATATTRQVSLPHLAATLLLQTHVPPSVLVNDRGDVVYIHGSTGPFLEPAQGQPSFNVVSMARDGLKLDLEAVLRAANAQGDRPVERQARVKDGRSVHRVRLVARKVAEPEPLRGLLLVTFETLPPASAKEAKKDGDRHAGRGARGVELEEELHNTKQSLESTIEQLQASNEELQSANEELSSMNEELQSANEELEISKEETQALNEELHTVNAELRGTVDDLSRTNDDMTNLLNSTEIATIFLDRSLRVRRFTMHATRVIHLIPTDVGRPLADIMPKLKYDRLVADAAEVFRTLVPKEVELESKEGGWFLMRLLPYRTAHEQIDGLVMTFVDVTKLREASSIAQARAVAESIVQAVREPLMVLDSDTRVILENRAFRTRFTASAEGFAGKLLREADGGRWDAGPLREAVERALHANVEVEDVEVTVDDGERGARRLVVSVRRLEPSNELPHRVLLTFADAVDRAGPGGPSS